MEELVWTPKWPDGCRRCGVKKKRKHAGQGLCWKCYAKARRRGRLPTIRREAQRRRFNGNLQFFCHDCSTWKSHDLFHENRSRTMCKECRLKQRRELYRANEEMIAVRRERAAAITRQMQQADKKRAKRGDPWKSNVPVVPIAMVQRWLEGADLLAGGSWKHLSLASGVPERTIYRIRNEPQTGVGVDVAEALASFLGKTDELREVLLPGVEGWSPESRYCLRCGRYDIPHHAKNYCRRCYQTIWYWKNIVGRPAPPIRSERWSTYHERCVRCGTTKYKHQGRGLCHHCYQQERKRNG